MSHERQEGRSERAPGTSTDPTTTSTTGTETGPEPADAGWPGPSGLGGPGSEELPVKPEAAPNQAGADWAGPEMDETDEPGIASGNTGEAARQRDEYLDALRRLQAEFDNYRKRVQRQQHEILENAAASLVKKLLPVLDTADLALAHGGGEDVKQVAGTLFDILSKEGLERIDPQGQPFDPANHDAVAHEPVEGQGAPEMPEVSEVLRAGYLWKGQVLRPAMVKVRG
jgi:molecular chaperone GrpE